MKRDITYCIENDILEEYLSRKGSDVMNFLCAEYDYEMDMQVHEEEAYEDGFTAGKDAGMKMVLNSFIKYRRDRGHSSDEIANDIMDIYDLTRDEVDELMKESSN